MIKLKLLTPPRENTIGWEPLNPDGLSLERDYYFHSFLVPCAYVSLLFPICTKFDSRFLSMVLGSQWLIFRMVKVLHCTYIILFGFGQLCFRTSFSDNRFSLYTIFIIIRIGSRTFAGSWVKLCLVLVNGFQLFALVMKSSILDLARLLHIWTTLLYTRMVQLWKMWKDTSQFRMRVLSRNSGS